MAVITGRHAHGHAEEHHGHNPIKANQLGLWLFMLSESFLFAAALSARYYNTGLERPAEMNQLLGFIITLVLLLSSLTAYRSEVAAEHNDLGAYRKWTLGTLFFGAVFAVGVGMEWAEAFEYFPPATQFGSQFFTLTGLHAFHVLSGLIILALVLVNRKANARNAWPVEGAVKYWHFVDLVWVVVYPTLYLVG